MRIVSLGMYDLPEIQRATDTLWGALAARLVDSGLTDVPARPSRDLPIDVALRSPELLFGQTCGYPLTHALAGLVEVVAAPVWRLDALSAGTYDSVVVVRADDPSVEFADLRGRRVAVNDLDSQSGCNVLRALAAPLHEDGRFFGKVLLTGAHLASLDAVLHDRADVAAIDVVTWTLASTHRAALCRGLRILLHGPRAPSLPYVTSRYTHPAIRARLRRALGDTMADPSLANVRAELLLAGVVDADAAAYSAIPAMRRQAERLGFTQF